MSGFTRRFDGTNRYCPCCGRETDDLGCCRCVGLPSAREALARAERYADTLRALGQDERAAELGEENAAFRQAIERAES